MRWVRLLFEVLLIVALIVSVFAVQQGSTRGHSLFLPHFIFAAIAGSISVQGTWCLDDGDDAISTRQPQSSANARQCDALKPVRPCCAMT